MASINEGSSHPQDPRQDLAETAKHATRCSINLDGCVSRDKAYLLRGGGGVVRSGTIDLREMMDKVKIVDGRLWEDKYGNRVAIKSPHAGPPIGENNIKKFLKEAYVWCKLTHANVLPLLGITTEFDLTVSIVSPWMENGNAHNYVQNKTVDPRPLIEGIAEGMHYLHNHKPHPIFHGDLKGVNVLISDHGEALLTDFGFSVVVNSSFSMVMSSTGGTKGTLKWMSPEILDGGEVSPEADVWAFGMTALELFTRKDPFHLFTTTASIITRIVRGGPDRPSTGDTCARLTDEWWAICTNCWEYDPVSRPTMSCIIQTITEIMKQSQASVPNGGIEF